MKEPMTNTERVRSEAPTQSAHPLFTDADTSALGMAAWHLVWALHSHLPEDKRPQSWSSLSEEQNRRIYWAMHAIGYADLVDRAISLAERVATLDRLYSEHIAIVNRIWAIFGTPSFEELKGRSIYDLITDVKARAEAAEAEAAKLRAALAHTMRWAEDAEHPSGELLDYPRQAIDLAEWLRAPHDGDCTRKAHTCMRCHAERLLQEADAFCAALDNAGGGGRG